jgi:Zn-dependent membrane protease YugP
MGGYGLYLLFALPALLLGLWAQFKVQSAFKKFSQVRGFNNLSGAQVARRILEANGLYDVQIEETSGLLSDHYDPSKRVLRLSQDVFRTPSLAAAGIAAHEAGHALQHKEGYAPLKWRSMMVPTVQIGSWLGPIIFIIGLLMSSITGTTIAWIGLGLFALVAVFALVTLPVEFDASRRARAWLTDTGMIYREEMTGVNSVLNAAALTYVAGAAQAISTLLYYAFLLLRRD